MEGPVGLGGWLHTEINVRNRELNPDKVTHLSTNWARCRLTSLIEITLHQTTKHICGIMTYYSQRAFVISQNLCALYVVVITI